MAEERDTRPFNIQGHHPEKRSTIPWWLAEIAFEEYSKRYGNGQSLQTLHDRHGFGRRELVALIRREDL